MISELLPDSVVSVEMRGDSPAWRAALYPQEAVVVAHAVDRRRREFASVRACARTAMATLGLQPQPVLPGEGGAPRWPEGVVGSMTHCSGYRAAALARIGDLASLGIDAEPHGPLPGGVLRLISTPAERDCLEDLAAEDPAVHWDRLLFSAKESVYKAWFPLTREPLGFTQAALEVTRDAPVDAGRGPSGRFRVRPLTAGRVARDGRLETTEGRWAVQDGLVMCAVAIPHD